jgi:hypothetical protein
MCAAPAWRKASEACVQRGTAGHDVVHQHDPPVSQFMVRLQRLYGEHVVQVVLAVRYATA